MLKFSETEIVFREFPDETTLAINLTNCPHKCPGCHSPHLQSDCGTVLDKSKVEELIRTKGQMVTCIGFMGGDSDVSSLIELTKYIRENHPQLKIGWYSGNATFPSDDISRHFDYIKIGPYVEERGPLNERTTNQRLYKRSGKGFEDITERFWK